MEGQGAEFLSHELGYECIPGADDEAGRLLVGAFQPHFYQLGFARAWNSRFDGDRAGNLRTSRAAHADISQQITKEV